jgi:hypothetical protein
LGSVCGIVGFIIYLGIAFILENFWWQKIPVETTQNQLTVLGSPLHSQINMDGHLLKGLAMILFIIAFLGLTRLLETERPRLSSRIGGLFGIIACPIMVAQMLAQGTVRVRLGRMFISATDEAQRQSIVVLYKGLQSFDMGLDLAFDTFFFAAWILLGLSMFKSEYFGKIFGALGIVLFGITAVLKIWTAPNPPSFEMAPIVSFWALAAYVQMLRSAKSIWTEEKRTFWED